MRRVLLSRWLCRRIAGADVMLCAWAHWRHHWSERWLDALIFWDRGHCRRCADWEAVQGREVSLLDDLRRQGWM